MVALVQQNTAGTTSSTSPITLTLPAASTAGNTLIAVVIQNQVGTTGTGSFTTPSGWNLIGSNSTTTATDQAMAAYWKISTGDTSVAISNSATTLGMTGTIQEWSGLSATAPFSNVSTYGTISSATATMPSTAPTSGSDELLVFIVEAVTTAYITATTPTGFTAMNVQKYSGSSGSSDIRLKTNIKPYTKGLKEILAIQPVNFEWNGKGGIKPGKEKRVSIVAQDMKKILPDTIGTKMMQLNPEDVELTETYTFDSSDIIFTLVNAVKELTARIKFLETKDK
jgi:hypothetical protein